MEITTVWLGSGYGRGERFPSLIKGIWRSLPIIFLHVTLWKGIILTMGVRWWYIHDFLFSCEGINFGITLNITFICVVLCLYVYSMM